MKKMVLWVMVCMCSVGVHAQRGKNRAAVLKEISGMEVINTIYPKAAKVDQLNDVWFKIVDAESNTIGYTLSSKPFTADVIGYKGPTPVIVVMDNDKVIRKVSVLSHMETDSYINKLRNMGFFEHWNGLTVEEAINKSVEVDAYSGATVTSVSLLKNMDIVLHKANQSK